MGFVIKRRKILILFKKILKTFSEKSKKFFEKKQEKREKTEKACKKIHKKSAPSSLNDMYTIHIDVANESILKKVKKY